MDLYEKTPIFTQTHEGNEFSSSGSNIIPALKDLRNRFGYPSENEKRQFFSISKNGEALVIIQEYSSPHGGRPNDILNVHRILKQDGDYDPVFLCQLVSDFLFLTHSARMPADKVKAFQTWVYFTEAVKLNPEWYAYNFIYEVGSKGNDEIIHECRSMNYERLKYAAIISRNMENTNRNIREAFHIASHFIASNFNVPFKIGSELMYFLYFCSTDSSTEHHDYLCSFLQELRKNQTFRHHIMEFLSNAPIYYDLFKNMNNRSFTDEIGILSDDYINSIYINDAYYLGIIEYQEYKKHRESASIEYLSELLLTDFYSDEGDKRITSFFAKSKANISKKVKQLLKLKLKRNSDQKARSAFSALRYALKEKHQNKKRLKKLI